MSTLLDALDPWMEKEACDAIVNATQTPKAKFVQVLKRSPKLLVLSDKRSHIVCTMSDPKTEMPPTFQSGSLLKLSRYEFIVADEDDEDVCSIQLQTNSIQLVGAQGMGILGDPIDIHETIQVRRAMDSINMDAKILMERLAGTKSSTQAATSREAGDPLAILENREKLEQLLGDDDSDDDDDDGETQEQPMTQHFESPAKSFQSRATNNNKSGEPLALLNDDDKSDKAMGREEDGDKTESEEESAVKMGDPMALLADSSKLQDIIAGDTDDDDDEDIYNGPETQDVRAKSPSNGGKGECEMPLKESPSRFDKSNSIRGRPRSMSNVSPVPLDAGEEDNTTLRNQLAAVAKKARDNKGAVDDDCASSASSDPIGISDMLLPPTQQEMAAPVASAPVNRKRLLVAPAGGRRGKGVRINAASAETLSRQRPDFLSASSPREVSTSTQPTTNLSIPSDQEYLRRFRKTRTFLDKIWEQRNNDVIKFN
jgi:hypothetical protein